MDSDKSSFLDFVRWSCAILVLLGHSQEIGGKGGELFVFFASHAHAAVMIFFVLSGYVISYAVQKKREFGLTLNGYYVDRFSRIYSVLIPAIVLTVVFDAAGSVFFETLYKNPALLPQDHFFVRLLINVFSLQGIWGHRVQFGSNPALWSIGYEFCYYILYGLFVWRPRYWAIAAMAVAIVVGPNVLAYGLIWLLGVAAFKVQSKITPNILVSLSLLIGANYFFQYEPSKVFSCIQPIQFIMDFLFAVSVFVFILSRPKFFSNKYFLKVNKEMAEFSYSSYAYHYPIMFMAFASLPVVPFMSLAVVFLALFIARLLFEITENKRLALKNFLLRW